MDHLPLKNPIPELRVPYFDGAEWDWQDPWTWPDRLGWSWDFLDGDFHGRTFLEFQGMVQSWMYFGTLQYLTGLRIETSSFISETYDPTCKVSQKWINTTYLPVAIRLFEANIKELLELGMHAAAEYPCRFLNKVTPTLQLIAQVLAKGDRGTPLAISILTLHELLRMSFAIGFENYSFVWLEFNQNQSLNHSLFKRMFHDRLWCPHAAEVAFNKFDVTTLVYLLSFGHCMTTRDHEACLSDHCAALQTREDEEGKHAEDHCDCTVAKPDLCRISDILEAGGTPILITRWNEDKTSELEVKEYEPGDHYCAISHVWADQFADMRGTTRHLDEHDLCAVSQGATKYYLWMDSLCIPLAPECVRLRDKAVQQMRQVYERATSVLVLDADVISNFVTTPDIDERDLIIHLLMSGWMQRLWTLQEAVSNYHVYIAVDEDTPIHVRAVCQMLADRVKTDVTPECERSLDWTAVNGFLEALPNIANSSTSAREQAEARETSCNRNRHLEQAMRAFKNPKRSRAGDETICIANFFGLDVAKNPCYSAYDS